VRVGEQCIDLSEDGSAIAGRLLDGRGPSLTNEQIAEGVGRPLSQVPTGRMRLVGTEGSKGGEKR
jgi:hypothetical protein